MKEELIALRQDVQHMLGTIGYGDETEMSALTKALLGAGIPAAEAQVQQLTEAQRQTVLLAVIASNTMGLTGGGAAPSVPAFIETPWGLVTPENANAIYASYPPPSTYSYQSGTDYVPKTGLAYLHKGERVIPAGEDGGVTLSIGAINISGAANPREMADEFIEILERRLREPGRLRTAVRNVARSA